MRDIPVVPGSPKILIVDDEQAICSALFQILRRAGFDPIIAPGSAEADALLGPHIEAMVLDLRMAHMRGDVFFFLAAARFPLLRRRTLFITGDITPEAERLTNQTGCPVLYKPFGNDEFVQNVRALLGDFAVAAGID